VSFVPSYAPTIREVFNAEARTLDFGAPSALSTINGWVSAQTRTRIPTILDAIDGDAVLYLVNAIYFKGNWRSQFDPGRTRADSFAIRPGVRRPIRMMSNDAMESRVALVGAGQTLVVELPYGGDAWAMTIVMPPLGTIETLADTITAAGWAANVAQLTPGAPGRGLVELPKFRAEVRRELVPALRALGMSSAMWPVADFTGMLEPGGPTGISIVVQKTFVDVNEEGTEAAAATAVGIVTTSLPPSFRIDRPFLFAIRERLSGTMLFVGKIVHPVAP
jgi:serine protease inhibitor